MFKVDTFRAGGMAEEVKMLAAKPSDLNVISRICVVNRTDYASFL